MTVLHAVRQMQIPLLALVLIGACAAKMSRVLRARSVFVVLDATSLFPPRLRRPATMAVCLTELSLGAGILLTSGRAWRGWADGVRLATALFFLIAMCAVVELREFRPDLGCGCFGNLSGRPPGLRSVLRAGLLGAAALVSISGGELTLPPAGPAAALDLGILVAEFLLVAAVSPEVGEVLARLGPTPPCGLRAGSPQRGCTAAAPGAGGPAWSAGIPPRTCGGNCAGGTWSTRDGTAPANATSSSRSRCGPAARPFIPPWCRGRAGYPRTTVSPGRGQPPMAFLRLSKAF
jgi:hypothetical protein